jgi:hypothetical protein
MKYRVKDRDIFIISGLVIFTWIGAAVALALLQVGLPVRILIGLVPVIVLAVQMFLGFRYFQAQDEVMRRITLESLSIAFLIGLLVVFTLGFMMKAGISLPLSFIDSGYIMEVALLIGYAVAYRRYQ